MQLVTVKPPLPPTPVDMKAHNKKRKILMDKMKEQVGLKVTAAELRSYRDTETVPENVYVEDWNN